MKLTKNVIKKLIQEELNEARRPLGAAVAHEPILGMEAVKDLVMMRDWQSPGAEAALEVAETGRGPEDAITDVAALVKQDVEYHIQEIRREAEEQLAAWYASQVDKPSEKSTYTLPTPDSRSRRSPGRSQY